MIFWDSQNYNCYCASAGTFNGYYQIASLINITGGSCYCPQGTITDANSQWNLVWNSASFRCHCPTGGVTLNTTKEKTLYLDYANSICMCELSPNSDPATQTLYHTTRKTCQCQGNLGFISSTSAECGCAVPTTTPILPYQTTPTRSGTTCSCFAGQASPLIVGTVWSTSTKYCECKAPIGTISATQTRTIWVEASGRCECPAGTTLNPSTFVCTCTTGSWNSASNACVS